MTEISQNLLRILSHYLDKKDISEFKKIVKNQYSTTSNKKKSAGIEQQLNYLTQRSDKYQLHVNAIVTFSKSRLSRSKYIELLSHIGEASIAFGHLNAATNAFLYIISEIENMPEMDDFLSHAYLALGDIYSRIADWKSSVKYIKLARDIFSKYRDNKGAAKCENLLGTIEGDKGNLKKANEHFENSLALLDPKKDNNLMGMLEINLGVVNNMQGKYDVALTYYQRALIRFEQNNNSRRISECRHNLGMLYTQMHQFSSALAEFDASISVSKSLDLAPSLCLTYLSKALVYVYIADYILANAFADKALEVALQINDRLSLADIYKVKGMIEKHSKNYEAAENYILSSLRINQEVENRLNEAESYFELGLLYIEIGKADEAREALLKAKTYFERAGVKGMIDKINSLLKNPT